MLNKLRSLIINLGSIGVGLFLMFIFYQWFINNSDQIATIAHTMGRIPLAQDGQMYLAKQKMEKADGLSVNDYLIEKFPEGTSLSIKGIVYCSNLTCWIDSENHNSVVFDSQNLPKEDKRILLNCDRFSNICLAIVNGRDLSNEYSRKIDPSSVTWFYHE